MSENLLPFSKIREILNSVKESEIVQYSGSVGTESSVVGSSYQVVELRLVYSAEEKTNETTDETVDS